MTRQKAIALIIAVLTTSPALASDPHYSWIDLTLPNETRAIAQIINPYGIERVVVESESSLGQTTSKKFSLGCATDAELRWKRGATEDTLKVTPCRHPNLDASDFTSFDSIDGAFLAEHFVVYYADTDRDGRLESATVQHAPVQHMAFRIHPGTSKLEDLECHSVVVCESMANYCSAHNGVGTCYDDHCECDLP